MRRLFLTVLVGCGLSVSAQAADLPRKAPVVAVYNWTGFYIGANAGYGWHDPTATFTPNDPSPGLGGFAGVGPPVSFNIAGALGGLQFGYNWQFAPSWVAGLETDFDFANIKGNGSTNYPAAFANTFNSTASEKTKWFGTLRARLGYLPANNLLVYATGGLAYGRVEQSAAHANVFAGTVVGTTGSCAASPSTCWTGTSSRTKAGWTAGAGAEYALTNKWTLKAEYLFVNLGSNSFTENLVLAGTSSINASFSQTQFHVVRGGINYRF
jgi:outer membrane immunogenic protein